MPRSDIPLLRDNSKTLLTLYQIFALIKKGALTFAKAPVDWPRSESCSCPYCHSILRIVVFCHPLPGIGIDLIHSNLGMALAMLPVSKGKSLCDMRQQVSSLRLQGARVYSKWRKNSVNQAAIVSFRRDIRPFCFVQLTAAYHQQLFNARR